MVKILNTASIAILIILLFGFLSQNFFPIEGLELFYEKKFYLAIIYIVMRIFANYYKKKEIN